MKKNILSILIMAVLLIAISGCASLGKKWKSLVSGSDGDQAANTNGEGKAKSPAAPSFNNDPSFGTFKDRQYKRVTKQNFSDEQSLEENAGSLWKKEGQGSFLFAQNNLRVIGDIVNVEIEGKVADNLTIKANLLKKSQTRAEVPAPKAVPRSVAKIPRPGDANSDRAPAQTNNNAPPPAPAVDGDGNVQAAAPAEKQKDNLKFDSVPCRIVEKNGDGSYRVKGLQTFFIGKKEYRMIVTGNIRPDDISTDSISSSKIIDSKFDLVATNKEFGK